MSKQEKPPATTNDSGIPATSYEHSLTARVAGALV